MKDRIISRREWLRGGVQLVVLSSASAAWLGCTSEKLVCTDTNGLNTAAKQLRAALEYRDLSPEGETKNCNNCQFFRPSKKDDQCGACTLVQGPINPAGYCNSWAPKES